MKLIVLIVFDSNLLWAGLILISFILWIRHLLFFSRLNNARQETLKNTGKGYAYEREQAAAQFLESYGARTSELIQICLNLRSTESLGSVHKIIFDKLSKRNLSVKIKEYIVKHYYLLKDSNDHIFLWEFVCPEKNKKDSNHPRN